MPRGKAGRAPSSAASMSDSGSRVERRGLSLFGPVIRNRANGYFDFPISSRLSVPFWDFTISVQNATAVSGRVDALFEIDPPLIQINARSSQGKRI